LVFQHHWDAQEDTMTVEVADVPDERRYEARVDGEPAVAGFAQYIRTPELIAFVHTEVQPGHEGKGVGSALVRVSLDEARAAGLRVLATCPFYAAWIARHPEYADLLYQARSKVSD
jgi:predicted GNAT family acetyltransferase